MTRLHPDDIQAIAERVVFLLDPAKAPEKPRAAVIPMARQIEIRRKAEADMANKLIRRAR